jgi:FKBP-type peptidyl-prolyl cis-trans isomerase
MAVGSEYRFWMPPALAFNGRKGMVVFDIQLLQLRAPQPTP